MKEIICIDGRTADIKLVAKLQGQGYTKPETYYCESWEDARAIYQEHSEQARQEGQHYIYEFSHRPFGKEWYVEESYKV